MLELDTAIQVLDSRRTQNVVEYKKMFLDHLKIEGRFESPQQATLKAGIDCGRWVVNCECGGGIALHPDWKFAGCLTCGRSWTSIKFPSDEFMAQIEAILRGRPRRGHWSWWPEETLEDLCRENLRYGWPIPEGIL